MIIEDGVLKRESSNKLPSFYRVPKTVTEIDDNAFYRKHTVKIVRIPKTVSKIGNNAFCECSELRSINLSDSINSIGEKAFAECKKLRRIKISSKLTKIENGTFSYCDKLRNFTIPDSITSIGNSAFAGCLKITKADVPESVTEIGDKAFYNCQNLKSFVVPSKVTSIKSSTFRDCSKLKNVTLSNNITSIEKEAFNYCNSLLTIELPETLKFIGERAFASSALTNIEIPNSTTYIDINAFSCCTKLESVKLPKNLENLSNGIFSNCVNLKTIDFPTSLKSIGEKAFSYDRNLDSIKIPDSVEVLGSKAFEECSKLSNITLSNSLNEINENTFFNCRALTEIEIPQSVQKIQKLAFGLCTSLKNITLHENLISIGSHAFNLCTNLESIKLPNSLEYLGEGVFEGCTELKQVNLPEKIDFISGFLFHNCHNLESIKLSSKTNMIGRGAFSNCNKLKSIKIPESVGYIAGYAFSDCLALENINLPKNLESIEENTFKNCTALKSIKIPEGVKSIGASAFEDCRALKSIELPSTLISIDKNAFKNCYALSSLLIPDSVQSIQAISTMPNYNLKFLTKVENGYVITSEPINQNSIHFASLGVDLKLLGFVWDKKEIVFNEQKNPFIKNFYNNFIAELKSEDAKKFIDSHNFTFFKQLKKFDNGNMNYNTYKFLYNIGALTAPMEDKNGKKVDYAQKTVNFLLAKLDKKEISIDEINTMFASMDVSGFKQEFTEFFIKDFDALMAEEKNSPGFISKCYNEFEKIQKTNTSNRGSQRQLKPTAKKFMEYFDTSKFTNVTPETRYISTSISPYFSQQYAFDRAVKIHNELKEKNVPTRLLITKLEDTSSSFDRIDALASDIQNLEAETLGNLASVATNEFTFEWLEKNDPTNFYLGKLCSCCAHLDGAGYSIMHASMVHPNVQNLVIRNKRGEIIAKSTLFINPKEGYGVFNNVEIETAFISENRTYDEAEFYKEKLYSKYVDAVIQFAEAYNKENPKHKLKQINVGMNNNDLYRQIKSHNEESNKRFKANYSKYGVDGNGYAGDSRSCQYVIWQLNQKSNSQDSTTQEKSQEN